MERMTKWDENFNHWDYPFDEYFAQDVIDRLAAYEDLGLTPGEITAQLNTYSALLCEITNNKLSKTNYALEDLLPIIHDIQAEECETCHAESEESMRKRLRHVLHSIYTVTVVDYIDEKAQDPAVFLFDNEHSANQCLKALSNGQNKVFMTKEEVYGSFCVGGQI